MNFMSAASKGLGIVRKFCTEKYVYLGIASIVPVAVYVNRFLIPDYAFDTLYYHLFSGVRGASNFVWPFSTHEFYPIGFGTIAPVYDALIYVCRLILGYRLGTVIDLAAYIGTIFVAYKLMTLVINFNPQINRVLKAIFFLNAILVTELLFQLATQYVDVLNAFFVLLGLYIFMLYIEHRETKYLWIASLFFGVTFLAKVTNGIYIVPFYVVLLVDVFFDKTKNYKQKIGLLIAAGTIALAPSLIYWGVNFTVSGNPIFPMYNNIFRSVYSSPISFSAQESGVGGQGLVQQGLWPIVSFWYPTRLAEPHNLFNDWKLGLYWLSAIALCLPLFWKKLSKSERYVILFFLISVLVWGKMFGIMRYAAVDLILGGLILLILFIRLSAITRFAVYIGVALALVLVVDNYRIIAFNLAYDMSWRPNLAHNTRLYISQRRQLFNSTLSFPQDVQASLRDSEVALECAHQTSGLLVLSGYSTKPLLDVDAEPPAEAITNQRAYRRVAARKIYDLYHKNNVTFAAFAVKDGLDIELNDCIGALKHNGAAIQKVVPLGSFLGYPGENPVVILGQIDLQHYVSQATE